MHALMVNFGLSYLLPYRAIDLGTWWAGKKYPIQVQASGCALFVVDEEIDGRNPHGKLPSAVAVDLRSDHMHFSMYKLLL